MTTTTMTNSPPTAREILIKATVIHTVTYFAVGVTVFYLLDYPTLITHSSLNMRALSDPLLVAGPLFQPIRGLLFGGVFYLLREPFFRHTKGWLTMWMVLVGLGILGTFGAPTSSIEGVIYSTVPLWLHLALLPELLVQSALLSLLLFYWVNHPAKRWLSWTMGAAFAVVLLLPALALVTMRSGN